ncbi:hypothetical protein K466DRAFT_668024 [Polyporus arcularius HHB13444]|uniref:NADP-dependent oxidoreductase domain-containing protein n=1 Tax=Polyporus arcularius HHB13444 TaxID=1314778 RepID=A0A5C3NSZ6_9APHY|nr:hypothetical protein K466DRAFT_668024 [Polyporus arcularius HHB13444]
MSAAELWAPPTLSPTKLGRHRQPFPTAGIHVSPICLGAMSIGDKWAGMGTMDKEASFKLLDAFYEAGGNFIDSANNYQDETSEGFLGDWSSRRRYLHLQLQAWAQGHQATQKTPYVFPIVGGRKVEHLHGNIQALDVALSDEHVQRSRRLCPSSRESCTLLSEMAPTTASSTAMRAISIL